ncbi:MAG: aldehyde dehydrogenase family protein [Cytophagales bacterium]
MNFISVNPLNNEHNFQIHADSPELLNNKIERNKRAYLEWKATPIDDRLKLIAKLGTELEHQKLYLSNLINKEMGKKLSESIAEIEKCISTTKAIQQKFETWIENIEKISSTENAKVIIEPLGGILGIMPWNFPFWQVFRFCLSPIALGNTILVKHAPNVPMCAIALDRIFEEAGFPEHVYVNLFASVENVEMLIAHPHVKAVSFTGSSVAGSKVASLAGKHLKKSVLELGGSDAFIVMEDADLSKAAKQAVSSRLINSGQSCVAAKRFIVHENVYDEFLAIVKYVSKSISNDANNGMETYLSPLARLDLKKNLSNQVELVKSFAKNVFIGSQNTENCFYPITILEFDKMMEPLPELEFFGPVFSFFKFKNIEHAIDLANQSSFGLGASIWGKDEKNIDYAIKELEVGTVAVNSIVKSDVNMPFGGIKMSGYGRELGPIGILEFANIKTIFM